MLYDESGNEVPWNADATWAEAEVASTSSVAATNSAVARDVDAVDESMLY